MGRIVDLCGEVAAAAEEGTEGLVLPRPNRKPPPSKGMEIQEINGGK